MSSGAGGKADQRAVLAAALGAAAGFRVAAGGGMYTSGEYGAGAVLAGAAGGAGGGCGAGAAAAPWRDGGT